MAKAETLIGISLGVIMFLAIFVTFISLIPQESYAGEQFQEYYTNNISGSDFLIYNETVAWNQTRGSSVEQILDDQTIEFTYGSSLLYGHSTLQFTHITHEFLGIHWFYHRVWISDIENWGDPNLKYDTDEILLFYDNATDVIRLNLECSHLTGVLSITSNDPEITTAQALTDGLELHFSIDWEINVEAMGTNILAIMLNLITGQTVRTGEFYVDVLANALITIPIDVTFAYVLYRLIAGLIPTISGGSGV